MHRAAVARSHDANIVLRIGLIAHPMSYLERIVVFAARVPRYHYLLSLTDAVRLFLSDQFAFEHG